MENFRNNPFLIPPTLTTPHNKRGKKIIIICSAIFIVLVISFLIYWQKWLIKPQDDQVNLSQCHFFSRSHSETAGTNPAFQVFQNTIPHNRQIRRKSLNLTYQRY